MSGGSSWAEPGINKSGQVREGLVGQVGLSVN
jgi:hypothetical protein